MRSHRQKLERIDIDELFSSPVNRGMLSFLERPPEEAEARLREKQKVDAADATRMRPGGELPPSTDPYLNQDALVGSQGADPGSQNTVENSSSAVMFSPDGSSQQGELPSGSSIHVCEPTAIPSPAPTYEGPGIANIGSSFFNEANDKESSSATPAYLSQEDHPQGKLSPQGLIVSGGKLPPDKTSSSLHVINTSEITPRVSSSVTLPGQQHPQSKVTHGVNQRQGSSPRDPSKTQGIRKEILTRQIHRQVTNPGGNSPSSTAFKSYSARSGLVHGPETEDAIRRTLQIEALDGSIVGRRQKVRRAVVAQDGHSSGEQLLYQVMWNAASVETPETRLISIGYSGMSTLCKLEKSNCKKNVQGLLQKLALEIAEPHQSVNSTGTTYRLFSYKEILQRREAAGLIWVIRTSGVRFVDLPNELPPASGSNSPLGRRGNFPLGRVGESESPPGSGSPIASAGKSPTHLEREEISKQAIKKSSSEDIHQLCIFARSQIAEFDDDACTLLWNKCREVAPDCTPEEVIYSFELKLRQLFNERAQSIGNPVGLMIWSVLKMFEGPDALYLERRRAKADEAVKTAETLAQFEQNRADWQALLNDPSTTEEDKQFYRKLLGQ